MNRLSKPVVVVCLLVSAGLLVGCESARKAFSVTKSPPDEFAVYSRPPLSLPPEYKLRPPAPGTTRPQNVDAKKLAERVIKGNAVKTGTPPNPNAESQGLQALLRDTGAADASPDIRLVINEETSNLSEQDQAFVDRLIFWVDEKPDPGTVVDAEKEQKRIQENLALGKPITAGETPKIKRKRGRKGLLDF